MPICSTCNIDVALTERTTHVRSDWHIYNLKRVVASLPPIPEDVFNLKKKAFSEPVQQAEKKTYCEVCKTLFHNDRSFDAHLNSKKHTRNCDLQKRNAVPSTSRKAISIVHDTPLDHSSDEQEPQPQALPLGSCLFCNKVMDIKYVQGNVEKDNYSLAQRVLDHMKDAHSFSVPYPEKLADPAGLLVELGRIVGEERACIYCGRQFYSRKGNASVTPDISVALTAVRNHMLDKPGHKQLWCGENDPVKVALLVAQSEQEDSNIVPPVALAGGELFSRFYDYSVVFPTFLLPDLEQDVYEVRLPSGTVLGHRSMRNIYRQHLTNPVAGVRQLDRRVLTYPDRTTSNLTVSHMQPFGMVHRSQTFFNKRVSERQATETRKAWELATGIQGNLVKRSRLRRQC